MPTSFMDLIYNTGDAFLPTQFKNILSTTIIGSKSTIYVEGWSIMHFFMGILTAMIIAKYSVYSYDYYLSLFIFHTLWELWQVAIGMSRPWVLLGHNGFMDTFIDTLCFLLGGFVYKNFILH